MQLLNINKKSNFNTKLFINMKSLFKKGFFLANTAIFGYLGY